MTPDDFTAQIMAMYPNARIHSLQRTPQHNAEVGGVANSDHIPGNAVDFSVPGMTSAQLAADLKARKVPNRVILDEGSHVHWSGPRQGAGGFDGSALFAGLDPQPQGAAQPAASSQGGFDGSAIFAGLDKPAAAAPVARSQPPRLQPPAAPVTVQGTVRAAGSGAAQQALALAGGSHGDLRETGRQFVDSFLGGLVKNGIINPDQATAAHGFARDAFHTLDPAEAGMSAVGRIGSLMNAATGGAHRALPPMRAPTTADLTAATHTDYTPQNRAERYAKVGGGMAMNALAPGSGVARAAAVVLPTLGSEGAREAVEAGGGGQQAQQAASIGGGILGGALTGVRVAPRLPGPGIGTPAARALTAERVSLTPGQRFGGMALAAEDKLQSAPILGDAIRGARMRGRESLNRAVANRALAPIGEVLPREVSVGNDAVAHVNERLSAAYNHANSLITGVTPDAQFTAAIADIRKGMKGEPPSVLKRFDALVTDRVLSRFQSGPLDGPAIQDIKSQLGELAADNLAGGGSDRTLGRQLSSVAKQVSELAGRTNPEYLAAQQAADRGWANFVRLRNAAGRTGTDSGVFTPSQLKMAVRAEDSSVGKGATARGDATMADLANNAASTMNSVIPNSGTTDRALWAGLGASAAAPGHIGLPIAGGLTVAAVPYLLMGRRIALEAMRPTASPELLAASAKRLEVLSASEPKLVPLYHRVLHRLRDAAPIAASSAGVSASQGRQEPPAH